MVTLSPCGLGTVLGWRFTDRLIRAESPVVYASALDALCYRPGRFCERIALTPEAGEPWRMIAAEHAVLGAVDAAGLVGEWAAGVVDEVLFAEMEAGRWPDTRSWEALTVFRGWLHRESSLGDLRAAHRAAERPWEARRIYAEMLGHPATAADLVAVAPFGIHKRRAMLAAAAAAAAAYWLTAPDLSVWESTRRVAKAASIARLNRVPNGDGDLVWEELGGSLETRLLAALG